MKEVIQILILVLVALPLVLVGGILALAACVLGLGAFAAFLLATLVGEIAT